MIRPKLVFLLLWSWKRPQLSHFPSPCLLARCKAKIDAYRWRSNSFFGDRRPADNFFHGQSDRFLNPLKAFVPWDRAFVAPSPSIENGPRAELYNEYIKTRTFSYFLPSEEKFNRFVLRAAVMSLGNWKKSSLGPHMSYPCNSIGQWQKFKYTKCMSACCSFQIAKHKCRIFARSFICLAPNQFSFCLRGRSRSRVHAVQIWNSSVWIEGGIHLLYRDIRFILPQASNAARSPFEQINGLHILRTQGGRCDGGLAAAHNDNKALSLPVSMLSFRPQLGLTIWMHTLFTGCFVEMKQNNGCQCLSDSSSAIAPKGWLALPYLSWAQF